MKIEIKAAADERQGKGKAERDHPDECEDRERPPPGRGFEPELTQSRRDEADHHNNRQVRELAVDIGVLLRVIWWCGQDDPHSVLSGVWAAAVGCRHPDPPAR